MTTKATEKMIVKNIARAIRGNEKKIEQLRKLKERCVYLTSSDGIHITAELYEGNIARFIIEGTRSNMTVTVNTITNQIIRKPRGAEPWYTVQAFNMNVSDIEEEVKNMESWRLSDSLIEAVENDGIGYNEFMKEQEKINEKNASPFGLRACMDSVVSSVEMFGKNPLQMLKEYEQRAQEDVFFNKTMIEAVKQYIEEHELDGLTAEEFEDRAIRKEREQLILELMEDAKAISGKNADKWTRTKERDIFKRCDEWNESHYEQQEYGIFMCYQDRDSGDEFTGFCIEDDYFVTFPQEGAEEMTKEERKEAKREIRNMRHDVIEAYNGTETPTEAIEILVDERGYEGACEAVATVVNMVSPCDGRISHMVRKWANSIDGAYNNETCEALGMYFDCSHIHTAHVNQLGEAMKNYEPKEEEPSLSTYPLTDLGEVLETLDENKTVVVYANGSANAPEVARYDGRNSIPTELNSARVHHYAQDINAYYVYLEEMPTEYEDEGVIVEPNNGSGYAHIGSMYDALPKWNMTKDGAPADRANEFWQIRKLPQEPTANAVVLRQVATFSEAVEALKEIKREHDANLIDVCSLSKEIRDSDPEALTDISYICDYDESTYAEDAFCEIANNEMSIYYSDIIKFISEHVEEVGDTITEMGWDAVGADLYKAGQYTEYLTVNNWLWEHSTEAYKVYALDYIRSTHGEKINWSTWERIECEIEQYGEVDRLWDIERLVDEVIGSMKERERA